MLSSIVPPQFISASKEINERAAEYWPLVMDVARHNNVKRIVRCSQIMGRNDTEEMSAAQIFYPCMQCADIFFLKVGRGLRILEQSLGHKVYHAFNFNILGSRQGSKRSNLRHDRKPCSDLTLHYISAPSSASIG